MKVIILAAGHGKNFNDLFSGTPKCILEHDGKRLLDRQLNLFKKLGIPDSNITIVIGFQRELIENQYKQYKLVVNPHFFERNNSHSLYLALKSMQEDLQEDLLVVDGDLLLSEGVVSTLYEDTGTNVVVVKKETSDWETTGILTDTQGNVLEIGKHLWDAPYTYLSVLKLSSHDVGAFRDFLEKSKYFSCLYTVPLNDFLEKYKVSTHITEEFIQKISTTPQQAETSPYTVKQKSKILLTGASGLLGQKIYSILSRTHQVEGLCHKKQMKQFKSLDLTDEVQLLAHITLCKPEIIIHTAAIADPDICENQKELAYSLNVEVVARLCDICREYQIKLIHLSTDYVFDGRSSVAYPRNAERNPLNYYGYTKKCAEDVVLSLEDALLIRIPIIYGYNSGEDKETFVTKTLKALSKGQSLKLDADQIRYPVLIDEVALSIGELLGERGIIHLGSDKGITKYQWAHLLAREFGYTEANISPAPLENVADRPQNIQLSQDSIQKYNLTISDIEKGTQLLKKQMNCAFQLIYKSEAVEKMYQSSVGAYRVKMGMNLGKYLKKEVVMDADCVVGVPNSGLYYAMGLATSLQLPYIQSIVKNSPHERSFNLANYQQREDFLEKKLVVIKELVENKNIILVDEAIFTGITLKSVCDMLKGCGAKKIHICIPTSISFFCCHQYVQPNRALLSEKISEEFLADYFKVSSVHFKTYEAFEEEMTEMNPMMCFDCFKKG